MILEKNALENVLGKQQRHNQQLNSLFAADCEILKLNSKQYLCTSMDSISEEVTIGLYKSPALTAWMSIASSVSDLAASGSNALGLTLSTQWKFKTSEKFKKDFFKNISAACQAMNVHLLGGDSGYCADHCFTSSIMGMSNTEPLTRIGAKNGDYLVLHHAGKKIGLGPALALSFLYKQKDQTKFEKIFRPTPDWQQINKLRPHIHAAIDTSDGIFQSINILASLNKLSYELYFDESLNHPAARAFCKKHKIHELLLWLSDHGDFQTLLCISEKNISHFLNDSEFSIIGRFNTSEEQTILHKDQIITVDSKIFTPKGRDEKDYKLFLKQTSKYLNAYR